MGARTLEAQLTARLLAFAGAVLVAVAVTAVVVTDRVLEQADTDAARAHALAGGDALARELAEGDAPEAALAEVIEEARAQGVTLAVRRESTVARGSAAGGGFLPELSPGACATVTDDRGVPWRACATGPPQAAQVRTLERSERADRNAVVLAAIPIATHRAVVRTLWRGMGSVVAVALLALWLAVRRALRRPVAELVSLVGWTERMVDAEHPIDPPTARTREIARLEAAFDALVRRLLESLARERANSAHIAHELRTPLTAITAELEAVRAADAASREAIVRVQGDVARLADVIEAILVLSDRSGVAAPDRTVVNVADLARDLAPEGTLVEAPDEALVEGDERLMILAARNLVDNARKYGRGVRFMRVSLDRPRTPDPSGRPQPERREGSGAAEHGAEADTDDPVVRLAVVDRGPGLDETARRRMFERYWRGSADGEGRGLGLALVRAVAERHSGRAEAKPAPDGCGLEVAMTLGRAVGWTD